MHYNVVMIFELIDDDESQYMYVVMMYCDYGVLLDFDEESLRFIRNEKIFNHAWEEEAEMKYFD